MGGGWLGGMMGGRSGVRGTESSVANDLYNHTNESFIGSSLSSARLT